MERQAAPVSLTGGQGFSFEDHVATFFLLHIINGLPPFGQALGIPFQEHWQCRDMGWLLDDLGIELKDSHGDKHFVAISVKDNKQITSSGFPSNFVNDIWEQWYKTDNVFKKDKDIFVLVVGNISEDVFADWNDLLGQALATTPERFIERKQTGSMFSEGKKALFESLACPLSNQTPTEVEKVELLKCVRVLHFDFRNTPSQDQNNLLVCAISATASGKMIDGELLLDKLLQLSYSMRPKGGSASLAQLYALDRIPELKTHHQFVSDWEKLERFSRDELCGIKSLVGNSFSFSRKELINQTTEILDRTGLTVIVGQSGIGKSTVAKKVIAEIEVPKKLWLSSNFFNYEQRSISLENDLEVILDNCQSAIIVIDGIERVESEKILKVRNVIVAAVKAKIKILITCINAEWPRIYPVFKDVISFTSEQYVPILPLEDTDLAELYQKMPQTQACLSRKEVRAFVVIPKLLDWIIELVEINQIPLNMTNFVECLWEKWICSKRSDRYARSQFIKEISQLDADKIKSGVPISSISAATLIGEFEDDGLLKVKNQIVFWSHDLIGDWARLHILIEKQEDFAEYVKDKKQNPRWQYSIQLFGQWLLSSDEKRNIWKELVSGQDATLRDLFLDSVIFATNAQDILNDIGNYFEANDGDLLKKLLDRLFYVATESVSWADLGNQESKGTSDIRLPAFYLWLPIFRQLYKNKEKSIDLAYDKVAEMCLYILLILPPELSHFRKVASELSIAAARKTHLLLQGESSWRIKKERIAIVWNSLLLAASEFPQEVGCLALELAGRTERQVTQPANDISSLPSSSTGRPPIYSLLGEMLPPWPLGPKRDIDKQFRDVCLAGRNILPLFDTIPEVAKEVLLAVCIESPHYSGGNGIFDDYEIWESHRNKAPCYFKGPWLALLQKHPDVGLELIIKLVNFATERWHQSSANSSRNKYYEQIEQSFNATEEKSPVEILLNDGENEIIWDGDIKVFGWYRNCLFGASNLSSALMALEKWLYDMVESKQTISNAIAYIIKECKSVAIGGVLCALSKKHPDFLKNELKFIISGWQFHYWELKLQQEECTIPTWGVGWDITWRNEGKENYNNALAWNKLPHRKECFRDISINVMLKTFIASSEEHKWFDKLIQFWQRQSDEKSSLRFLIAFFTITNYNLYEKNGQQYLEFVQPENLREDAKDAIQNFALVTMGGFSVRCRAILDGTQKLPPDQIPAFWQEMLDCIDKIDSTTTNPPVNAIAFGLVNKTEIICGGIAAVLATYDQYVLEDTERHNWVISQLDEIFQQRTNRDFDLPESCGNQHWDCFWNEAVILLFNKMPKIEVLRYWTGLTMFQYHYSAIECALSMAKNKWQDHPRNFTALINLAFYSAAVRGLCGCKNSCPQCSKIADKNAEAYLKRFMKGHLRGDKVIDVLKLNREYVDLKNKIFSANDVLSVPVGARRFFINIKEWIKSFFNKQKNREEEDCPDNPSEFIARAYSEMPERVQKICYRIYRTEIILDTQVLAVCVKMAKYTSKYSKENKISYEVLHQMVALVLWQLEQKEKFPDKDKNYDSPSKFEYLVFESVSFSLIYLEEETSESLYKPILSISPVFHDWIASFLDDWFIQELKNNVEVETFGKTWQAMISFALSETNWQRTETQNNNDIEHMWIKLMGMNTYSSWANDIKFEPIFLKMKSSYELWAREWMKNSQTILVFSQLCGTKVGKSIICDGIKWISEALRLYKDKLARKNIAPNISNVCVIIWQEHQDALEKDKILREAFFIALNFAQENKCPVGLKLHETVLKKSET